MSILFKALSMKILYGRIEKTLKDFSRESIIHQNSLLGKFEVSNEKRYPSLILIYLTLSFWLGFVSGKRPHYELHIRSKKLPSPMGWQFDLLIIFVYIYNKEINFIN